MKRADVERRGREGLPTVCVKYYGNVRALTLPRDDFGGMTWEWVDGRDDGERNAWWEWACEDAWRLAEEIARDVFGPAAEVYSDGRSGGWLVVHGLPDVDTWLAPELAKWARYCRHARETLADLPYLYAWQAHANGWEPASEESADELERDSLAGPALAREGSAEV